MAKRDRLKSDKIIARLFESGQTLRKYPIILRWIEVEPEEGKGPLLFSVSVSRRNFKSAVARNRLKRRIREAFRLNSPDLRDYLREQGRQMALMFIFTGKDEVEFERISHIVVSLIQRLEAEIASD